MPVVRVPKRKLEHVVSPIVVKRTPKAKGSTKNENGAMVKAEDASSSSIKESQTPPDVEMSNGATRRAGSPNKSDFVLRKYYPPEMTNDRAQAYIDGHLQRPIEELEAAISSTAEQRKSTDVKGAVVHWFRWDLRLQDNTALSKAYEMAKAANKPLICLYVYSHQDFDAHYTSSARIDFALRTLEVLRQDLDKLDIPLWVEEVTRRKGLVDQVLDWCDGHNVGRLYGNLEYEVDELRRDAELIKKGLAKGIAVDVVHDTCIVSPGQLHSGTGKVYAVYTPYFRTWLSFVKTNNILSKLHPPPGQNTSTARSQYPNLFGPKPYPTPAENKRLGNDDQKRLANMWPAGEHEAHRRLERFVVERVNGYADNRNFPAMDGTSALSVHFSAGTLSTRQAVKAAVDANNGKLDSGKEGCVKWISEIAWRDFYKGILVNWPHVCMNKPYKPEYSNIEWEYNDDDFKAWCTGHTGYPYIDAGMRQLNSMHYLHNRVRMAVASFIAKHLLLDWRKGERYFMENLIDGDFASNNGGWGWSSSTGADPQPYFRIFNPLLQSEKFDPKGDFIRKWVPELRNVTGKAVHDPYGRMDRAAFEKLGYPKPIVEHKFARERCLQRYKEGLGRNSA